MPQPLFAQVLYWNKAMSLVSILLGIVAIALLPTPGVTTLLPAAVGFALAVYDVGQKFTRGLPIRLGVLAVLLNTVVISVSFFVATVKPTSMIIPDRHRDHLKQLYLLLSIYQQQFGSYPTLQSSIGAHAQSGGVRDLYPLSSSGVMQDEALKLLQPSGIALVPFTRNPTTDEFDRLHIGYAYNSTATPDDPSNPPLMAERGVSDGRLDKAEQPVFDDGAHVLFVNGMVKFIPAIDGRLSTLDVSSNQWSQLRD